MTTKACPWEESDVRTTDDESPMAFLRRGRLYVVREVNARWLEDNMRTYRVAASTGSGYGDGTYDLQQGSPWAVREADDEGLDDRPEEY